MFGASDTVENHAGEFEARVECIEPMHKGGGGRSLSARIHDQDNGYIACNGDVGSRATAAGRAVEQSHNTFSDDHINIGRDGVEIRFDRPGAHPPSIQVMTCSPARRGMKGGIDVVRTDFEGSNRASAFSIGAEECQSRYGLTAAGSRSRDEKTGGFTVCQHAGLQAL